MLLNPIKISNSVFVWLDPDWCIIPTK